MTRRPQDPLRSGEAHEREYRERLSRARSAPVEQVIRAKILLGVADGRGYEGAARSVGRKSGEAASNLGRGLIKKG
jgi:hypothetical protein